MEEIKKVIKNSGITSIIILIYGILIRTKEVYIGMFLGSLISILSLCMIYQDVKNILYKGSHKKNAMVGYVKRYLLYGVSLGLASYFYGLPMMLGTAMGLLNVKFNILLMVLYKNLLKWKDKYLK